MSDGPILTIQALEACYPDGTAALHGVDLTVANGQRLALLGPVGAGKTALLLAIMRAVEFSGRIVVDGLELSRRTRDAARGCCGMIFQNPEDQLFMPTLMEDVAFGPLNQKLPSADARHAALHAIEAVGLSGLEVRPAHHLSGGQKQLAALATVLSMNVRLLLLDEPAASLDHRSRRRLLDILMARPEAMILATHDLAFARSLCSRAAILDEGRLAADGPIDAILSDSALLSAHGLG